MLADLVFLVGARVRRADWRRRTGPNAARSEHRDDAGHPERCDRSAKVSCYTLRLVKNLERCPRGRRGSPAKGVLGHKA